MPVFETMHDLPAKENWLEFITNEVSRQHPKVRTLCYPKEIQVPKGFCSPELLTGVAYSCADTITMTPDWRADKTTLAGHICCAQLIRYQVPTFFAAPDLCDALMQTEPPQDMKFSELKMPFPAFLVMLPEDFTLRYLNRRAPFLAVAQTPKNTVIKSPLRQNDGGVPRVFELNNPDDGFYIFSCVKEPDGVPAFYDWRAGMSHQVGQIHDLNLEYFVTPPGQNFNDPKVDEEISIRLAMLAINLLLAITAQPELITREFIVSHAKKKNDRVVRRAVWRPNFIGENFRVERAEGAAGTHASPYAHYRRGHMRNQKYGTGLSLTKLIWIKPVFVGLKADSL